MLKDFRVSALFKKDVRKVLKGACMSSPLQNCLFFIAVAGAFFSAQSSSQNAYAAGPDYRAFPVQAPAQIAVDESYEPTSPISFPVVSLSQACASQGLFPNTLCRPSADFDRALEQEYWRHIALQDSKSMRVWLEKKDHYVWNSRTPNAGRFALLSIFGNLHVYSQTPRIFNVFESPFVLAAYQSADHARSLLPRSPNTQAFYWALRNFTDFALGRNASGLLASQKMIALGTTYGEQGLAGPIGAIAHLMGSKDKTIVRQGIEFFDKCFAGGFCTRETSIAPYHVIGTRITQAEAYAYLGEFTKMDATFSDVEKLARTRKWPLAARIPEIRNDLMKPGGLVENWRDQKGLSGLRSPLGAAHRVEACSWSHIGNTVPVSYQMEPEF